MAWRTDMENAPKSEDAEILLYYPDFCGGGPLVVSGHWDEQPGREFEATWRHSHGNGDATQWKPLPEPPK